MQNSPPQQVSAYRDMWEDWGSAKKEIYLSYKFKPTHKIGLTNYVREQALLRHVPDSPNLIVLDAGCAAGSQLYSIADRIKEGHGVDIAQSLVDAAKVYSQKSGFSNLFFKRAEVENLPFDDETFDIVICGEVIEHVFDERVALEELLRVLKVDGKLVISVPNLNADGTWWGRLMRMIGIRKFTPIKVFSKEEIAIHGDAHVREYSGAEFLQLLRNSSDSVVVEKITSASYIDGPFIGIILKVLLKISFIRIILIQLELLLSRTGILWGRHLIVSVKKK